MLLYLARYKCAALHVIKKIPTAQISKHENMKEKASF